MNQIAKFLEEVQFEGYHNYESEIRKFQDAENYHYETMAFQFAIKQDVENGYDYGIGSYFKPFYEFADTIYPSLTDITCETLKYWQKRSEESRSQYLIARYSDLVWNFSKLHRDCIKNPFTYAIKAIDNYLLFQSESINDRTDLDIKHSIIRALNLAKTLNQREKLEQIARKMIEIENVMEDKLIGLWGFSYDEIIEGGLDISLEFEEEIIESMLQRVNRLIQEEIENKTDNFHAIEYGISKLTKYYFKKDQITDVRKLLTKIEGVINNSKQSQLKEFRYNKLLDLYHAVQIHEADNRIIRKISETAQNNVEIMKETTFTKSIDREKYETYINSYYTQNLEFDLKMLAGRFIPDIDDNLKMIEERRKKGIGLLSELISHVKINKDGMPITSLDLSNEQDCLANQLEITIGVQSSFFNDIFKKLIQKYELDAKKLGDILSTSPILIEENHPILFSGLESYFNENYIAFIHIMVPYIESTLRNVIHLTGDSIYKLNKSGGYDALLLGDILAKDYLENIMHKNIVYYLKFLYNDKKGFNIRNVIAHGLAHPSLFNKANADLIMHTLLIFFIFEKQVND